MKVIIRYMEFINKEFKVAKEETFVKARKCDISRMVNRIRVDYILGKVSEDENEVVYHALKRIVKDPEKSIHITVHSDGTKMEGIVSINTDKGCNKDCEEMAKVKGSICEKCYAETLLKMRKGLREHCTRNYAIMNLGVLDKQDLPTLHDDIARGESFGDAGSVFAAINMIQIAKKNKGTVLSAWTKKAKYYNPAFEAMKKPSNMVMVYSSPMLNTEVKAECVPFADKIFTVYNDGTPSNCAGIKCRNCMKCYGKKAKKTEVYIREKLR